LGESFVKLVPVPDALPFDDMFTTGVISDRPVSWYFSVEFVPVFQAGVLVLNEFDWFYLFVELIGFVVEGKKLCCI
jgi:hypothetical protein